MEIKARTVLAALAAAFLAVAVCGAFAHRADAGEPQRRVGTYFVDVRDRTNWESAERMRHARDKEHAALVASALASLRAADAERAEAERAAREAEEAAWDARERPSGATRGPQSAGTAWNGQGYQDGGFRAAGVLYGDDGTRFTWYSQRVLPGAGLAELNANGRHVDGRGYVVDGDGYIALASGSHAMGEVVETPVGTGKVYDFCPTPGTVDVYTDF